LLQRLTWIEVRSALTLAVMTAIVLPLLPDRTIDPWGALNPRNIWLFTLLAAALSYLGYILVRVLGPARGLLYGCLAGALVSSTAMTLTLARTPGAGHRHAGAASLAALVSILRVIVISAIIAPSVLSTAGPAAIAAALVFGLCGWLLLAGMKDDEMPDTQSRNPFDLKPLLLFALIFAGVALFSTLSSRLFGTESLAIASALSGMLDVDAAVLSILSLKGGMATQLLAGEAVLAALAANGVVRFLAAAAAGPRGFSLPLAAVNAAAALAGVAAFVLMPAV
jgi:uncharacterized membrane protein (DUF4010 family)